MGLFDFLFKKKIIRAGKYKKKKKPIVNIDHRLIYPSQPGKSSQYYYIHGLQTPLDEFDDETYQESYRHKVMTYYRQCGNKEEACERAEIEAFHDASKYGRMIKERKRKISEDYLSNS
jgi:hypothetical protein